VVLREGRVQQVGTPEELHNNPNNWHVADFMGYRNLVDLTVESVSGATARVAGHGLELTAKLVQPAAVGDTVRVAMRPSDLLVLREGESAGARNTIEATVTVVEYQGREFAVGATTASGQNLFVHAETAPLAGSRVTLVVDPSRVLVYASNLDAMSSEQRELAEVRG
jgi:putative spermidine/putrescine transport system ATP-binding protein